MYATVKPRLQKALLAGPVMGRRENGKEAGEAVVVKTAVEHRIGVGGLSSRSA